MTRTTASSNPTCARLPTIHTAALKCTPALFHTSHPTLLPPASALYYPFTLLEFSLTLVPTHSLTGWLVGLPFRFQLEWVVVLFEGKTKEKKAKHCDRTPRNTLRNEVAGSLRVTTLASSGNRTHNRRRTYRIPRKNQIRTGQQSISSLFAKGSFG